MPMMLTPCFFCGKESKLMKLKVLFEGQEFTFSEEMLEKIFTAVITDGAKKTICKDCDRKDVCDMQFRFCSTARIKLGKTPFMVI